MSRNLFSGTNICPALYPTHTPSTIWLRTVQSTRIRRSETPADGTAQNLQLAANPKCASMVHMYTLRTSVRFLPTGNCAWGKGVPNQMFTIPRSWDRPEEGKFGQVFELIPLDLLFVLIFSCSSNPLTRSFHSWGRSLRLSCCMDLPRRWVKYPNVLP